MTTRRPGPVLWTDALSLLAEAERLQRQFFTATTAIGTVPSWEPPVDTLETAIARRSAAWRSLTASSSAASICPPVTTTWSNAFSSTEPCA